MHSCLIPATCVWKVAVFLEPVGVLVTCLLKLASSRKRVGGGQHSSAQLPCRWFNPGRWDIPYWQQPDCQKHMAESGNLPHST